MALDTVVQKQLDALKDIINELNASGGIVYSVNKPSPARMYGMLLHAHFEMMLVGRSRLTGEAIFRTNLSFLRGEGSKTIPGEKRKTLSSIHKDLFDRESYIRSLDRKEYYDVCAVAFGLTDANLPNAKAYTLDSDSWSGSNFQFDVVRAGVDEIVDIPRRLEVGIRKSFLKDISSAYGLRIGQENTATPAGNKTPNPLSCFDFKGFDFDD